MQKLDKDGGVSVTVSVRIVRETDIDWLFLHDRKMIKYRSTIVFSKCNMQHSIKYTVSNTETVVNHSNYVTIGACNNSHKEIL